MPAFHNQTRRSPSVPAKLIRQKKFHLLALYYLLITSDLAREGVQNSGSYRFADHIYAGQPRGRFVIGKVLDAILLNLKSARSLRARYVHAKAALHDLIRATAPHAALDILAVPSGLAREFFEVIDELNQHDDPRLAQVNWHGLDLDPGLVDVLNLKAHNYGSNMNFFVGDALNHEHYPLRYNMVVSTGLTEFLSDTDTLAFYRVVHRQLKLGGVFFTSGMEKHPVSDYLLRNLAELHTQYRSRAHLTDLIARAGFSKIETSQEELQTIVLATKT